MQHRSRISLFGQSFVASNGPYRIACKLSRQCLCPGNQSFTKVLMPAAWCKDCEAQRHWIRATAAPGATGTWDTVPPAQAGMFESLLVPQAGQIWALGGGSDAGMRDEGGATI